MILCILNFGFPLEYFLKRILASVFQYHTNTTKRSVSTTYY
jgi:hypothetical protein